MKSGERGQADCVVLGVKEEEEERKKEENDEKEEGKKVPSRSGFVRRQFRAFFFFFFSLFSFCVGSERLRGVPVSPEICLSVHRLWGINESVGVRNNGESERRWRGTSTPPTPPPAFFFLSIFFLSFPSFSV